MKSVTSLFKKFWKDESGQGGTEYVLLLVVVVALVMIFREKIQETMTNKVGELSDSIMQFGK